MADATEGLPDADELLGRGGGPGCQLTVLGPVQDRPGGGNADRSGEEGLAGQIVHDRHLVGVRHVVAPTLAEHVGPQRAVGDEGGDVEHPAHPLDLVEVLGEALPVPGHAFVEGRAGDVLDSLHELDQPLPLGRPGRGEADAAVAHHNGGDAVPARRRDLGIPGDLPVVVGVDVDPTGGDQASVGVDLPPTGTEVAPHLGDAITVDGDVDPLASLGPGAVDQVAVADDEVVHRGSPVRSQDTGERSAERCRHEV